MTDLFQVFKKGLAFFGEILYFLDVDFVDDDDEWFVGEQWLDIVEQSELSLDRIATLKHNENKDKQDE